MCTLHSLVMHDSKTFSQEVIESSVSTKSIINQQVHVSQKSIVYILVHWNLILALGITNPPPQQHVAQVK